jgi:hypothetical protein
LLLALGASCQLLGTAVLLVGLSPMALRLTSMLLGEGIVSCGVAAMSLDLRPELYCQSRMGISLAAMAQALLLLGPPADREGGQGDQEGTSDGDGDDGDCRHASPSTRSTASLIAA